MWLCVLYLEHIGIIMFIFYCLEHLNIGIIIVYILLVCIFKGSFHIWMHFMTRLSTWDLFERGDFDVNRTKFGHNLCIDQIYLNWPCLMEFANNDLYFAESIRFYVGWIYPCEKEATRTINYNEIGITVECFLFTFWFDRTQYLQMTSVVRRLCRNISTI